jgi:uncharacterized RDD family membrane protein YckC
MEVQEDLLRDIEIEIDQQNVSVGIRFANYMIDLLIFYIIAVLIGVLFSQFSMGAGRMVNYLSGYFLYVSYFTFIEGITGGRSIGKLITGSKAVTEDGSALTWNGAFLRSLSRLVPFEPFSAFSGRPWHDRWTHTKVVKVSKR